MDFFFDVELENPGDSDIIKYPVDTRLSIKCWLADIQINWSYLLHCQVKSKLIYSRPIHHILESRAIEKMARDILYPELV